MIVTVVFSLITLALVAGFIVGCLKQIDGEYAASLGIVTVLAGIVLAFMK